MDVDEDEALNDEDDDLVGSRNKRTRSSQTTRAVAKRKYIIKVF